jgi:hypothetical protein
MLDTPLSSSQLSNESETKLGLQLSYNTYLNVHAHMRPHIYARNQSGFAQVCNEKTRFADVFVYFSTFCLEVKTQANSRHPFPLLP